MNDESQEWGSDFGDSDLDPQERKNADTYLDDPEAGDDEPWTPPQRRPRGGEFPDDEHDTFEQRIAQEEPDEGTAYGAPEDEGGLKPEDMVGGGDPDAVPAKLDFVGDPAEIDERTTFSRRNPNAPAEQAAMHVIDDDEQSPEEEDIDLQDEDVEYED